jgi:hypothetical protein
VTSGTDASKNGEVGRCCKVMHLGAHAACEPTLVAPVIFSCRPLYLLVGKYN